MSQCQQQPKEEQTPSITRRVVVAKEDRCPYCGRPRRSETGGRTCQGCGGADAHPS